jgi:hypothetical protein
MITITGRIAQLGYTVAKMPLYQQTRPLTDLELGRLLDDMFTKEVLDADQRVKNVGFLLGLLDAPVSIEIAEQE